MTDWSPPRTPKGQISRVPHLPGLDGMRAIAVIAVMIYHANSAWLHGGFLGVEVFFVISGYLITLLLIAEHERSGDVDLRQFWLRRFRRLLPALYLMLALLVVYLAVFRPDARGRTRGDIVGAVAYVANWYQIWVGAGYTASEAFAPLRHLWSLAVEEQFYVIWPLIMVAVLRRGRAQLPRVAMWLFGFSFVMALLMAVLFVPGDIDSACSPESRRGYWMIAGRCISINDTLYLNTFTRAGGLMLGAAFAMVWRPIAIMRGPLRERGRQLDLLALVGVIVLGVLMWKVHLADPALTMLTGSRFDPLLFRGGLFVAGIATLFVIAAVTHQRALAGKLLGNPVLSYVGTRSYGLYLFHWPIYQFIREQAGRPMGVWQFLLAMMITVPLTEASYRFVEMPIRQGAIGGWLRGERRRPSRAMLARRRQMAGAGLVAAVLLGWAGVSIAMAPNQCVGEVECSLAEADELLADTPPTGTAIADATADSTATADPPATLDPTATADPTVTADPTATTATTAPVVESTTTTVPLADRPPIAVGESVMKGAVPQLQTGGFTVYAEESRQGNWIAEVIGQLRASGQIGSTIVIQTGTNGPVDAAVYDQIMSFLPATEVETVIFLTVRAPDKGWIDPNNATIYSLPGRYPNVTVLEWKAFVDNGMVPGMAGDGIHLGRVEAKQTYANFIFDVIGRRDLVLPVG